ncbi:hypothetical protein BC828DRAFT_143953 [Blastocladiella britannica]|nr:hypothetical protein BC828DRAFT_143953 [Blastocladiella britannica]
MESKSSVVLLATRPYESRPNTHELGVAAFAALLPIQEDGTPIARSEFSLDRGSNSNGGTNDDSDGVWILVRNLASGEEGYVPRHILSTAPALATLDRPRTASLQAIPRELASMDRPRSPTLPASPTSPVSEVHSSTNSTSRPFLRAGHGGLAHF